MIYNYSEKYIWLDIYLTKVFMMRIKLLMVLISTLSMFHTIYAQNPNPSSACNNYTFEMVDYLGCGNLKFKKTCDEETIWNWGDGSSLTISKDIYVVHKFCKPGRYLVSISLAKSPNNIQHQLYVDIFDNASLDFTYTILTKVDCDKSIVKFESLGECLESYDVNGNLIPGSDQIIWDFGDGTTSTDLNPKHTFTSGGNFQVTLSTVSSACELQSTKTIPLGDPVTCCLDNITFDHTTWNVTESQQIANHTVKIKNEIRVKPGVHLVLNNMRVEMGKDARIIVERGARLDLNYSTLTTTSCGGYVWEGIEVWGSGDNFEQENFLADINGTNGILRVQSSVIEYSDEAISVAKKRSLSFFDIEKGYNGGYIEVRKSTFRNNYTSINIWPYKFCTGYIPEPCNDCNRYYNASIVNDNSFICNAPMRDERYTTYASEGSSTPIKLGVNHFVYLNGTYGMNILNNDFVNNYLTVPIKFRGAGIVMVNSRITLGQKNATFQKRIRGLTTGVRVSADNAICRKSTISDYLFSACQVAIDANSTALEVKNNQISIPNTVSPITAQGIHTRNCRSFLITKNQLNGISVGNKYGVLLKNNRTGSLADNTFNNLFTGSQSELLNENISINCNYYQNQNFSITIPNGRIASQGSVSKAAGNAFADACKSVSQNLNHIRSNVGLKYYYYNTPTQIPLCKSSTVNIIESSSEPTCSYSIPLPPCSPNCTKDIYVQKINEAFLNEDFVEVNRLKLEMKNVLLEMDGGYEVYKNYLDEISTTDIEAAMVLASTYYADGNIDALNPLLDQIAEFNTEESATYAQLMGMLRNAAMDNRSSTELNEEEILLLNELSMNDTTNAGYIAEALLYQQYEYDYNHNPIVFNDGNRMLKSEELQENDLRLFPNPSSDMLNIESSTTKINSVYIYNVLGELVYSEEINNNAISINTTKFPKGLYLVKISKEDKIVSEKLIIE